MKTVNISELIEAGVSFTIAESDTPLENLREIKKQDFEMGEGPGVDSPWWTTSGDNPVLEDQGVQADHSRSAGGWSDLDPTSEEDYDLRNDFEHPLDITHASEWSLYRLYRKRQSEERELRFERMSFWLNRFTSREKLQVGWRKFMRLNQADFTHCKRLNDYPSLKLTKAQVASLRTQYETLLKKL